MCHCVGFVVQLIPISYLARTITSRSSGPSAEMPYVDLPYNLMLPCVFDAGSWRKKTVCEGAEEP
jgi:hypothetical protein